MVRRTHLASFTIPLGLIALVACTAGSPSPDPLPDSGIESVPDASTSTDSAPATCLDRVPLVRNGEVVDPCGCCPMADHCGEGYVGGSPHPVFGCSRVIEISGACAVGSDANGCSRYDWEGSAKCSWPVDPACGPDSAAWSQPRPGRTLPVESTACQALGIAACAVESSAFAESYACFDGDGKLVYWGSVDHDEEPKRTVPADLPCSATQVSAWVAAYQNPCWKKVPAAALPASALTQLLDPAQLPEEVCSNVSGSRFRWNADCALVSYEVGCMGWPSAEPAPPYCTSNDGGNTHGSWWKMAVSPPVPGILKKDLSFLACCSYGVDGYDWQFLLHRNESEITLLLDGVAVGDGTVWSEVVARADATFTACGNGYSW